MKIDLPAGFAVSHGNGTLIAREDRLAELTRLGLHEPQGWIDRIAGGSRGAGRGPTAVVPLEDGPAIRLKQMRRGGAVAAVWRERYPGQGRLIENVTVPLEAARRGVATPAPVALMLVPGPPGFHRAWIAFEEIPGATDLAAALRSSTPPGDDEYAALAALIRRMHERGVEHRDLNLGNLLLVREGEAAARAWVVDLDRARLYPDEVPGAGRRRVLDRLERSYVKELTASAPTRERFLAFLREAGRDGAPPV